MENKEHFSDQELEEAKATFPKADRIQALIARLEAAEKVCISVMAVEDMIKIPLVLGDDSRERAVKRLNTAFQAWREAAGRAK